MENNKKILIFTSIVVLIASIIAILSFIVIKENEVCMGDPFKYVGQRLKDAGGNYLCSCKSLTPDLLDFNFNENGVKVVVPYIITDYYTENITYKGGVE